MTEETQNKEAQSSYRSIFKATSLFGGVQVYQILISIIKSKFIAVLLGPAGMGIQGLYQAAITLVQSITSLGLEQSAVRDVSEANASGDARHVGRTIAILRKLVWITGILGMIATIFFSPVLSKTSFGNYDYTIPFIILSVVLLLQQLSAGQRVVLQGMRQLKYLAKSSVIGSTLGLIVSVPLYYLLGVKGIVPTLILNAVTMLILTWFFSRKVQVEEVKVTLSEAIQGGKSMLRMGMAMMLSGLLLAATSYILRGYISYQGDINQVGLFVAGFTIMSQYTGMVFTAMGTDYYPRLAAINNDNEKMKSVINQQGEIALLIMSPLICLAIVFMPLVIKILYSDHFLPAGDYILWASMGFLFKVGSWAVAFSFVAKGAAKLFIINETISNIYTLALNILGYRIGGLSLLGVSFSVAYMIYMLQVYLISNKKYDFRFNYSFLIIFAIHLLLVVICTILFYLSRSVLAYVIGCVIVFISISLSFFLLDKRLGLVRILRDKF